MNEAQALHEKIVNATRELKASTATHRYIKRESLRTFDKLMELWKEVIFLGIALWVVGVVLGFLIGVAV